jgi:integrase
VNGQLLHDFVSDMRVVNRREATIRARVKILTRLGRFTHPAGLLEVDQDMLIAFERAAFVGLKPATVDIYSRNIQSFYRWALHRRLITVDPSVDMPRPQLRKGKPKPISLDDLRTIFACTRGELRIAYVLASFAGLRRGEICRLSRSDLDLSSACPTADIDGKGGKPRTVPLLAPVVHELLEFGLPRSGWLITWNGRQYPDEYLSTHSLRHLRSIGVVGTLHSMRHTFATTTYRTTHDLLMLKELLGHESVATTEIYAAPDMGTAHARLQPVADTASSLLSARHLHAVPVA